VATGLLYDAPCTQGLAVNAQEADFLADRPGFVAASLAGGTLRLHMYLSTNALPAYSVQIKRPGSA
jgi:hypothetical protein